MPVEFGTLQIQNDLEDLRFSIEAIDMENVKKETLKSIGTIMSKRVADAVEDSPHIQTGNKGPYESGRGPSMGTKDAWVVKSGGKNRYTLTPHPLVAQRAYVLNEGWPGGMEPNNAEAMKFTVNGVPMFREHVDGPIAAGYWEAAFDQMEKSGQFERVARNTLEREIGEQF